MVDALVFSKDRAAQLDLLLRSIDKHAPRLYSRVTVLYTTSALDFLDGYAVCVDEHPRVFFAQQHGFDRDVHDWLRGAGPTVSFLVDDDVFYRDAPRILRQIPCSLRGGDYDYPFSVDGNIYPRGPVVQHLLRFDYNDPTELEANAHALRSEFLYDSVAPIGMPCLVGVPANRVSERSGMPHMGVDPRDLNDAYLQGERIEAVFDRDVYPAHWPVEYRLRVPA